MKGQARGAVLVMMGALVLGGAGPVAGQWALADRGCDDRERNWGNRDSERVCMAFEADFQDPGMLAIDGGQNGGVTVEGWEGNEVRVRARVWATARDSERAEEIVDDVRLSMRGGDLGASGPDTGRRESWGVNWEVMVPRSTDLEIETMNGGIRLQDVRGDIDVRALNGGVHLTQVAGDVRARTTNGGLDIELDGPRWDGEGLDAQTTNGGITLVVPSDYSAQLETGTVNGGFELDFPITVRGRIGRRLSTTLGEGGPVVRAMTTNGGVHIVRGNRSIR